MVGHYSEVYVMDWGLAKILGSDPAADEVGGLAAPKITDSGVHGDDDPNTTLQTRVGQRLGTPLYMSPEQAVGANDNVGPPADVYALGTILFELVTLERYIQVASLAIVLKRVTDGEHAPFEPYKGVELIEGRPRSNRVIGCCNSRLQSLGYSRHINCGTGIKGNH